MKDNTKNIQVGDFVRSWLGHEGQVWELNTNQKLKNLTVRVEIFINSKGVQRAFGYPQNQYFFFSQVEKIACKWPQSR